MSPGGKQRWNAQQALRRAEREARALELKKLGATNAEIGRQLGCSESRACHIWREALAKLTPRDAEVMRHLEAEKLDQLEAALRPAALQSRPTPQPDGTMKQPETMETRLRVADRIVRISERRARLEGLDRQPEPPAAAPPGPSDEEKAARLVELLTVFKQGAAMGAEIARGEPVGVEAANGNGAMAAPTWGD